MSNDTIPCKRCKAPTKMLGTKLCDPCWEHLRHCCVCREDKPAPAAPVTDAEIEAAIEAVEDSSWDAALEQTLENTKQLLARADECRSALRALIAQRVKQAGAAAEDLARAVGDLFATRVCSDEFEIEQVRDLEAALAAFRKAQGGGA